MQSRYDFLTESSVVDTEDQQAYPDVSSAYYVGGQITKVPTAAVMDAAGLQKFWKWMLDEYSITYYDDLLLNANGIPYLGMLEPGSVLYKLGIGDLEGMMIHKVPGYETDD